MKKFLIKIMKYLFPLVIYNKLKFFYIFLKNPIHHYKSKHYDITSDLNFNEKLFNELELDIKLIKPILIEHGLDYNNEHLSWHYHLFAGLKKKFEKKDIKIDKILEIGTYDGKFANFLSIIFPNTEITTIDLKQDDEIFLSKYDRKDKQKLQKFFEIRKKNLDKKNIRYIDMNSINLEKNFSKNSFDLIWIDGEHLNPQVTIDIFQSIKLIKKNGFICVDDVVMKKYFKKNEYVSNDSYQTLEYLNKLKILKTSYIIKRVTKRNFDLKKFISLSVKFLD